MATYPKFAAASASGACTRKNDGRLGRPPLPSRSLSIVFLSARGTRDNPQNFLDELNKRKERISKSPARRSTDCQASPRPVRSHSLWRSLPGVPGPCERQLGWLKSAPPV